MKTEHTCILAIGFQRLFNGTAQPTQGLRWFFVPGDGGLATSQNFSDLDCEPL